MVKIYSVTKVYFALKLCSDLDIVSYLCCHKFKLQTMVDLDPSFSALLKTQRNRSIVRKFHQYFSYPLFNSSDFIADDSCNHGADGWDDDDVGLS